MKRIYVLFLFFTLLCCRQISIPDILSHELPLEMSIIKPVPNKAYDISDEFLVQWIINHPLPPVKIKIELYQGEDLVRIITTETENDGRYSTSLNNIAMDDAYHLKLSIISGAFKGKSWRSGEFILKESWKELGPISRKNSWGASVTLDKEGNPFVLYLEPDYRLSLKHYNNHQWMDLEIEKNDESYLSNYFSMALSDSGELVTVYTKDFDDTNVKKWSPPKEGASRGKWQFYNQLADLNISFGPSVALNREGYPIVSFSTLIPEEKIQYREDPLKLHTLFSPYLRTRVPSGRWEWSDQLSSVRQDAWNDEGIIIPEYNPDTYGNAIRLLNESYWQDNILLPFFRNSFTQIFTSPPSPTSHSTSSVSDFLKEDTDIIIRNQSRFYSSLAIDSNENLVQAYQDGSSLSRGIYVIRKMSGHKSEEDWDKLGEARISEGHCGMPSLALGPDDWPVVAYKELNGKELVHVKKFDGMRWNSLGVPGSGKNTHPSLTIDERGRIYVAAGRWVKRWNDGTWEDMGFPVDNGGGMHPQWMAANYKAIVVAYVDGDNGNTIQVKRRLLDSPPLDYQNPDFTLSIINGKLHCTSKIILPSGIGTQYNLNRTGSTESLEIHWGSNISFSHNFDNCTEEFYVKRGVWNTDPANGEIFGWTEKRKYIRICNNNIIYNE